MSLTGGARLLSWPAFWKRAFDFCVAAVTLMLLSPLAAVFALVLRLKLGSPIFFTQMRPGLGGEPFKLIKLRSMSDRRNPNGELLPDAERLTPFGRMLRSTSLDELPELWNVLKGEMSLVGPRPLLVHYLELYSPLEMRRHEVLPGLTGWVQVNGRNAVSWPEKFAMDVWYVDNQSFLLDMKILLLTVWKVATRQGISAEGEATMPLFQGSAQDDPALPDQASGDRSGIEA